MATRIAPACMVAMALALAAHVAILAELGEHGSREALASAAVSTKFDDGFYDKVQRWIAEAAVGGAAGASGAPDAPTTRNVMIMVDRMPGGGQDPNAVARQNKDTVVRALGELGATDIVRAESLSFVTATVPLARLAELAEYASVHRIGDGEELLHKSVGTARSTIAAEPKDQTLPGGRTLTGSGVIVAVLDDGIESPALNTKVDKRQHCADLSGCRAQTMSDRVPDMTKTGSSHGTQVAGVLAASSGTFGTHTFPAGIATGVTLFDVIVEADSLNKEGAFFTSMANALDWAYTNGAHIANLSYGSNECNGHGVGALIVDEAVDKGMVVVGAAGNEGKADRTIPSRPDRAYGTIQGPHCSHNPIAVGGVNDRDDEGKPAALTMYYDSSRGPTKSTKASLNGLLKPDIAAPAENLHILAKRDSYMAKTNGKGTSLAAPQVAAAAALLLEARPSMTPAEVKAALLLGADWQGKGKCTASLYETSDSTSYCSHARQLTSEPASDRDVTLLNHVGLGVLNVGDAIRYATTAGHVVGDHLATADDRKTYTFRVTDATKPAKVILAWISHPKGTIPSHVPEDTTTKKLGGAPTDPPSLADLNLVVQRGTLAADTHVSASARQSVEFVHFTPKAGTYTVTVSAATMGERPTQAFALASTHALASTPSNTAPVTWPKRHMVDPSSPTAVRLYGHDAQGDAVSFRVTGGTRGTVSASEQLHPFVSRVVYTPGDSFGAGDTLTVTPYDGRIAGAPATVTLVPDRPPAGSDSSPASHAHITDWYDVIFRGPPYNRPLTFWPGLAPTLPYTLPATPVRHVVVEGEGADGASVWFRAGAGAYTVAAPAVGSRHIDLASPLPVTVPHFMIQGMEESEEPARVTLGTSASSLAVTCPTPGAAIAAPRSSTTVLLGSDSIGDNTGAQSTESVIGMRHAGTLTSVSVSVNIWHRHVGDLKVELVSPDGARHLLHDRTGGANLRATYTSASAPLSSLVGKAAEGDWRLAVGDYAKGSSGMIGRWSLSLKYTAACPSPEPPAPTTPPPPPAPTTPPPPPAPEPARPTATSYGVYVANTDDREVRAYLPDGTYSGAFVTAGSGRLDKPWSIAFGPDGNLYVSDLSGGALRRYGGTTGAPMGTGADAATNSLWARPSARPYGIAWNGDTLYAATYNGIERFDLTGKALGIFGDASRTATAAGAALVLPHDVEFGGDRMYVADRGNHRVAYYSASTGSYLGAVSSSTSSFTTRAPSGLAWDGTSLYQSAGDPGRVNRISPSTLALVRSLTGAHIDEPFGMDAAPDGRVYVANMDTDQVAVIIAGNTVSTLFSSRLDDPHDVAIGLRYAPAAGSGASGPSGAAGGQGAPNSEPSLDVLAGGRPAGPVIDLAPTEGTAGVSLRATDAEGDAVAFSMDVLETTMAPGAAATQAPALADHGNGTATLTVDGSAAGEYLVALSAADAHGEEWGTYLIRVAPAGG